MPIDEILALRVRDALARTGEIREIRMFGGLCFMLNGNMVAGASRRGLLLRVGKDGQASALARPGVLPMEMAGCPMRGYVFVDPPPEDDRDLDAWLRLAVDFVLTLPPKNPRSKPRRNKREWQR
ncbi:MAG TPA: TfoX/Sxy family protein [Stellaceae bacterium]|nr:TfoX/Sxy family protein [Stellaceae bacterium]HTV88240.1 TfoX/Sxy family protein [Stellaceae bacterium]